MSIQITKITPAQLEEVQRALRYVTPVEAPFWRRIADRMVDSLVASLRPHIDRMARMSASDLVAAIGDGRNIVPHADPVVPYCITTFDVGTAFLAIPRALPTHMKGLGQ